MMFLDSEKLALLRKDLRRRCLKHQGRSAFWKARWIWSHPQYRTLIWFRLWKACRIRGLQKVLECFYLRSSLRSGLEIHTPDLGGGMILPHWGRILLNASSIGENLYVFHGVTVGNDYKTGTPRIGDDVFLGAGCSVLGGISVGNHVIVAAGSVVVNDVPSHSLVAGNPARVIRATTEGEISKMIGY